MSKGHHNSSEVQANTEQPSDTNVIIAGQIDTPIALAISALAVSISFVALLWNVIRDLIIDRPKLAVSVDIGTVQQAEGAARRVTFVSLAATKVKHTPPIIGLIEMTNIGRKPIVVAKAGAKHRKEYLRKNPHVTKFWILRSRDLPKTLKPYEAHGEQIRIDDIVEDLKADAYEYFFVTDTKGKSWRVSERSMHELVKLVKKKL